ncbi:hypothetical protein [Candidatus Sulfurimonas baltica]|uniref:TIGR03016 family PEP-CTERM system-associated outer membrane protein n=1 Tax=Candidatus Sulfurimonas baltica TaxID=2740404 RepID=A0A7S7RMZ0_9BACT|nr:hypothetical protein [Candidatus Sulfurimonas baltica]QOY51870.1 hypothetical protein HUE88_12340 [Candidatus Sulfurimonas baltica]
MKKRLICILLCIMVITPLNAKSYPDRGMRGSIGLNYEEESLDTFDTLLNRQNLIQEYNLNYDGNIYNPKLLDYKLFGSLRYSDMTQDINGNSNKAKSEALDYGITTNVFKSTKFPMTMFYNARNSPSTIINDDIVTYILAESKNYGISGSVRLNKLGFTYGADKNVVSSSNLASNANFSTETSNSYNTGVSYLTGRHIFRLKYKNKKNTTTGDVMQRNDEDNSVKFTHKFKIDKDIVLDSDFMYNNYVFENDGITDTTTMGGNINLTWNPQAKYQGTILMNFNRVDFYSRMDSNSSSTETMYITDTLNINQNFVYRPNNDFSISQNISYFYLDSDDFSSETSNIKLNSTYKHTKKLSPQRSLTYGGSAAVIMNQNNRSRSLKEINKIETETETNTNFNANANISLSEKLPSINSSLNVGGGYAGSRGSDSQGTDTYILNSSLSSRLWLFYNNMKISYASSKTQTILNYSDDLRLNYSRRVGLKGRLDSSFIARYTKTINDKIIIEQIISSASLGFKYRFFTRLNFSTNANLNQDFKASSLTYGLNSSLGYNIGLSSISLVHSYREAVNSTKETFQAKFTRRF